jgi:hypothetical protein
MARRNNDLNEEAAILNAMDKSRNPFKVKADLNEEAKILNQMDLDTQVKPKAKDFNPFTLPQEFRDWAWAVGEDSPNRQWLLSDFDVYVENPHYQGEPQEYPEL